MDRRGIECVVDELFCRMPPVGVVEREGGASEKLVMFDRPLLGIGAADDALFARLRDPDVVGPWHLTPNEWLSGARSVASLFFPIAHEARASNLVDARIPSSEWRCCYVEGQAYLRRFAGELCRALERAGARAMAPILDSRYRIFEGEGPDKADGPVFGSAWSERHAAYICGLGTFSLSRGLITPRGMAGRLVSIVTDAKLPADARPYVALDDYCIRCGACVSRCPVGAISLDGGKRHEPCCAWLFHVQDLFDSCDCCGKCQVGVPCERSIPLAAR